MNIKTNLLKRAQAWLKKNWEENEWYNVSMNKLSKTTAPDWFIEYDVRINKRLDNIELRLSNLEKDMIEVKKDIVELKQDVAVLKQDVAQLKKDVSQLKQDMIEVKKDIAEIKSLPTIQRELKQKRSS